MAFIEKKDPVVINIKLTSKGRELLSQGKLNFQYYAVGDSEIDYAFNAAVETTSTGYTAFNSSILKPTDKNPEILSFITRNLSGESLNLITGIPISTYTVDNTAPSVGFFTSSGTTFITDTNHVKQPDAMVYVSGITGGSTIKLKKTANYGTSGAEPSVDDILLIKWTINNSTTGYTVQNTIPRPFLFYKIQRIISGTLAGNDLMVEVDRSLPDFRAIPGLSNICAGVMVYYSYINYSGSSIFNQTPTEYLNSSVLSFLQNSQCPTVIFPFWNMSIIFTDEIAGVQAGDFKYTQFDSRTYGGFVSYIQNQAPVYKKLGVIHYTNSSPANVYAEGFYLNTPTLQIPTIMWHKSVSKSLGVILSALGSPKLLTGTTKSLNTEYYDLADPNGNIVGKIFTELKIFVIEDQELLFAMSYKSNRSWTLPDYMIGINSGAC